MELPEFRLYFLLASIPIKLVNKYPNKQLTTFPTMPPGGELHPAAGGGAEPRAAQPERQAPRPAVLEEPGGDAADRLPRRPHTGGRPAAHHQRPAAGPSRQGKEHGGGGHVEGTG